MKYHFKTVHPTCCENAKWLQLAYINPSMIKKLYYVDNKPNWTIILPIFQNVNNVFLAVEGEFVIEFCPFCGTKLPDVRLKDIHEWPQYVMTVIDGGYYCDTCKQRLNECQCSHPEEMWELKPNQIPDQTEQSYYCDVCRKPQYDCECLNNSIKAGTWNNNN